MNAGTKVAALNKFRGGSTMIRQPTTKILVVFDVQVKSPDVFQVPLVINYGRCSCFKLLHRLYCLQISRRLWRTMLIGK